MKNIIEIVPKLIGATQSGKFHWQYMEDAPCLSGSFAGNNFMICKAKNDDNEDIISLNYIDKNDMIIGEFMKWKRDSPEYDKLDILYTLAEKSKVLLTAC